MPSATPAPKPRALVADDDEAILTILRYGLESAGLEVITASDGASALRELVDHLLELDLLVTDLDMPGLDGPTLVRIIRAEGGERELPILVLASSIGARDRELLIRLGVTDLVEKRAGSGCAVRRAVELAVASRDRRLGMDGETGRAVLPLGPVRLVRARGPPMP